MNRVLKESKIRLEPVLGGQTVVIFPEALNNRISETISAVYTFYVLSFDRIFFPKLFLAICVLYSFEIISL